MASWWCESCRKYCKASAQFCSSCGTRWDQTSASTYTTKHPEAPWNNSRRGPQSPRRRQSPRRLNPTNQAAPADKAERPKGKGKGKAKDKPAQTKTVATDRMASLPPPPQPPTLTTPPPSTTTELASGSTVPPPFTDLMSMLMKTRDDLPPDVQAALDAHADFQHKTSAKNLHKVVAQQAAAKRGLADVRRSRTAFMSEWIQYLGALADLLQSQVNEKNKTLAELKETEDKWTTQLSTATKSLAMASKTDGTVIEVDDEAMEAEVAEVAEDEAKQKEAAARTEAQEARLAEQLHHAKRAAQEELDTIQDRERTPRRLRTEEPAAGKSVAKSAAPATGAATAGDLPPP